MRVFRQGEIEVQAVQPQAMPRPPLRAMPLDAAGRPISIFVSHATADRPLADRLVDFLQIAGVPGDAIFYSSQRDMGIPAGKVFPGYLRARLADAALVIMLMTKSYLCARFCLMELGAQLQIDARSFPIVVPPAVPDDVAGILPGVQVAAMTLAGFQELREVLDRELGFDVPAPRWQLAYRRMFEDLPSILSALPPPPMVDREEHDRVLSELEGLRIECAALRALHSSPGPP